MPAKFRPRRALDVGDGAAIPLRGCPFCARKRDPTLGGLLGGEPLRLSSLPTGELGRRLWGGVKPTPAALRRAPLAWVVTTVAVIAEAVCCDVAGAAWPVPPDRNSVSAAAPAARRAPMLWPADPPPDEGAFPAPPLRGSSRCVAVCPAAVPDWARRRCSAAVRVARAELLLRLSTAW